MRSQAEELQNMVANFELSTANHVAKTEMKKPIHLNKQASTSMKKSTKTVKADKDVFFPMDDEILSEF